MTSDLGFATIRQFVLARTGIQLTDEKRYLIETRLDPVLRERGLPSLEALASSLRSGDPALESAVADAMTTNETLFFRDKGPFDITQKLILPKLIEARRRVGLIRIWCAACSTGQEPYSLAMLLDEMRAELRGIAVEIVATDISEKVIEQAKAGVYSQFEVQRGLPIRMLLKHFTQEGTRWRIRPELQRQISFRRLNLLQPFQSLGRFDIVFCRNVLIYFSDETKRDVLSRIATAMAPDGFLLLGGAETALGLTEFFATHRDERAVYVRADSGDARPAGLTRQRLVV
jgi:chemotaxis protein methyltransferase CheR